MIRFTVDGDPVVKERPRLGANGNVYTPGRTTEAEARIGWLWKAQRAGPPNGTHWYALELAFVVKPGRWVDVDNLTKLVLDALNRLAYKDDRQVRRVTAEKRWSTGPEDPPRTEVEVYRLGPIVEEEADDTMDPEDDAGGDAAGARDASVARHPSSSGRGSGLSPGRRRARRR